MAPSLTVPTDLVQPLTAFCTERGLDLEIGDAPGGLVRVQESEERRQCNPEVLYRGGWVSCQDAWALAGRLHIPREQAGALLDRVQVKVKNCQLGCF